MGSEPARGRADARPQNAAPIDRRPLNAVQIALLIGSILVGVALGLGLLAQAFVHIPTDVRRLGILHRALQSGEPSPEIVVFGNSVLMSGVDGQALTAALPGNPVAWNCASTGQTLLESYLLSQDLPTTVETAVYSVFPQPDHDVEPLNAQKYNSLFMYGFRPEPATLETVRESFEPEVLALLERSTVAQIFASRWAVRQFVDTRARSLLRSDLALDKATFDLFHPQSYLRPIDPEITQGFIDRRLEAFETAPPVLETGAIELARALVRNAEARGRSTVFLFPPLHPEIVRKIGPQLGLLHAEFARLFDEAAGVRVIDATELLDRSVFIDDLHPTNDGAAILSRMLADALREDR